jgi:hypothetical protein
MRSMKKWVNRKVLLFISFMIVISILLHYRLTTKSQLPFIPLVRIRSSKSITFKKIAVAQYTTTFGSRTDSHTERFNSNLQSVCEIIDPEEYPYADGVIVNAHDFVRFPSLSNTDTSYRKKYQSQLWLLHTEESPRNTYRSVQMDNITYLDDWFNLTATLKPESDLHIQYKVIFHTYCSIQLKINLLFIIYTGISYQT